MPFVQMKLIKEQTSPAQKERLIAGLTDLIAGVMGRDRDFTVITVEELPREAWAIGGLTLDRHAETRYVLYINVKISKGTSNPTEMALFMAKVKEMTAAIYGASDVTNYCVIEELNPDAWGYDGLSMTIRNANPAG